MNRSLSMARSSRPLVTSLAALAVSTLLTGISGALADGFWATAPVLSAQQSSSVVLNPRHPERYVVQRGDTLWDIASMFLRDPWYWPEIWFVNPQVDNPHLIYPGDVLTLVYLGGQPQIRSDRGGAVTSTGGTERLSPQVRELGLARAIPTIPFETIGPFLTKGTVLEKDEIDGLPYIAAIREERLTAATNNDVYVRGEIRGVDQGYTLVHVGDPLIDPDDGDLVGYKGIWVGEGIIRRGGDPATLRINSSAREAVRGDKLILQDFQIPLEFYPRPPTSAVDGTIISVVGGVSRIGQYMVVVLNRGERHGMEAGHVLTVWQAGERVRDDFGSGIKGEKITLPEEAAGHVMIFKTYDRISYALVMEATSEFRIHDRVRKPI